jgi:hypothetical protein
MALNIYRLVKIKEVAETHDQFSFSLEDSTVSFSASKEFLRDKGVTSITQGEEFFIKGKTGNEDWAPARPDALEDIRKG